MNNYFVRQTTSRCILAALLLLLGLNRSGAVGELLVPLIKTATAEYKNVKIFNSTPTYLSFAHESGTAVIKVSDVDQESLAAIERARTGNTETAGAVVVITPPTQSPWQVRWETLTKQISEKLNLEAPPVEVTPKMIWIAVGAVVFSLWFSGLCASLICRKAGRPGGLLAWLPVFQMLPLFHAARMSRWWFLALIVPVLNLIAVVLWCVKITQARGKGFFTAVMLILPATNFLAYLYLAFSNGDASEEDAYVPIRCPHALAVN